MVHERAKDSSVAAVSPAIHNSIDWDKAAGNMSDQKLHDEQMRCCSTAAILSCCSCALRACTSASRSTSSCFTYCRLAPPIWTSGGDPLAVWLLFSGMPPSTESTMCRSGSRTHPFGDAVEVAADGCTGAVVAAVTSAAVLAASGAGIVTDEWWCFSPGA